MHKLLYALAAALAVSCTPAPAIAKNVPCSQKAQYVHMVLSPEVSREAFNVWVAKQKFDRAQLQELSELDETLYVIVSAQDGPMTRDMQDVMVLAVFNVCMKQRSI